MSKPEAQWFNDCYKSLFDTPLSHWLQTLPAQLDHWQRNSKHGEFDKWCRLLAKLPSTTPSNIELDEKVAVGSLADVDVYTQKKISGLLQQFMPWRKGPFYVHDIHVDTEWRSDWKWDRVYPHITPLKNRTVLDVGCGSGYHMWRMLGQGASRVIGIDPTQLFFIQFQAIKHFIPRDDIHFLPLGIEEMQPLNAFDTVFSMGVLYHRKDPIQFLNQLKHQLRKGGELVLETLVVDGDEQTVLMAGERYAQMRNVWFLPSTKALAVWLERVGFENIRVVDVNHTTLDEQRSTPWMDSQSLKDFLDPEDITRTIEGYPAPQRAVLIANRK
ncbi:MAG TPA: tRNA 5-methoxyuridine(34)/uridine 5-oxyacetic acid(34) synthase CmoB [Alteromonas australica]|jgi:tRNA (mo5U34)-methyltransferase|uniref:tRNA U34 carboxymethyltransferase n=1 Tax=Alteromonas australica TaxID=589873 RepID=A0A349TW46_9ALTE|nr:tRNA 5-methoxyuridine(34)/uridine 5-oxyacetic acid(34) synthase CmoB [Alteromonas australica]MAB91978.1 tRNA 5-methoxyuridine(34)/uridine 5-oxyacetic acid(34) synthase CmoB [Alteromonas sp.]MAO30910.1 tRNA 5-methoxyuridine(34)/uridine 5-oxyacetic acid(34) synthase CmoB [Alteromonas sp.]MBU33438.1 tRNA 5-methoxyuridine(34)/uridine 5-oxyacetic acid(34) synthase CmoB [Alteromonas sp.]HAI72032.1 tRNA 5-methoxyuridine(34)/uridine 5-oxyacetic acid(34) synthase CmoB [Alteromonas australica]HAU2826|tara:strand:+ start:486 stop:1469 length:984 start_codon:yes stop_codon:yes gene_type:complete